MDLQIGYWIFGIIVSIITIIGAVWKAKEYYYKKGIEEGRSKSDNASFLVKGDIVVKGTEQVFKEGRNLLQNATKYIKIATVTGAAWLLNEDMKKLIEFKKLQGVNIKILLQDPDLEVVNHIEELESEFTEVERPYERPASSIKSNITLTLNTLASFAEIRFCPECFLWKGTIVDGKKVMYTIFDVPRNDTPLRLNENKKIVEHFEKYYFDILWEKSRQIQNG